MKVMMHVVMRQDVPLSRISEEKARKSPVPESYSDGSIVRERDSGDRDFKQRMRK